MSAVPEQLAPRSGTVAAPAAGGLVGYILTVIAESAGGLVGYILTVIAESLQPGSAPSRVMLFSIPIATAGTAWLGLELKGWMRYRTIVRYCKRDMKDPSATKEEQEQARRDLQAVKQLRRGAAFDRYRTHQHAALGPPQPAAAPLTSGDLTEASAGQDGQ